MLGRILDLLRGTTSQEIRDAGVRHREVTEKSIVESKNSRSAVRDIRENTRSAVQTLKESGVL